MNNIKHYDIETIIKIFTYFIGFLSFIILIENFTIPYYFSAFFLFLISIYLEYKKIFIKREIINILGLLAVFIGIYQINIENFLETSLSVLIFLLALKFLEEKKFRDYMEIYLLSILILAGSSLISPNIIFLFYLLIYLVFLNVSIILLTYYSQNPQIILSENTLLKLFLKTSIIPILAIPLTIFFFLILPRIDTPFFGLLAKKAKAKTGFSENVKLGEVSEIKQDDTIIFRAKMPKIEPSLLYWRGIVLEFFDGKTWLSSKKETNLNKINLKGKFIKQTIILEPYDNKYLFGLDKPYKINTSFFLLYKIREKDFTFFLPTFITSRIKYDVFSVLTETIPEKNINKNLYLQLPKNISQRIKNLAKSLKGRTNKETANNILKFLKYGDYKYSLKNLPISKNPLEDFLFTYKYGNCEYFASAMAILLRLNNIPARLVAGYKGGTYNELGNYYIVKQSDAHVWVEAFIDGAWIRYDPTPQSIPKIYKESVLTKLKLLWETLNYYYLNFVLNYDVEKQVALIKKVARVTKLPNFNLALNKNIIILSLCSFMLVGSIFICFKHFLAIKKIKPEEKILNEFLKILEKKGYKKKENEGLEEFAFRIKEENLKREAFNFIRIFEKNYYKDKPFTKKELEFLKKILKNLKNI